MDFPRTHGGPIFWDGSAGEIASYVIDLAMEQHLWDQFPKTSKPPYS